MTFVADDVCDKDEQSGAKMPTCIPISWDVKFGVCCRHGVEEKQWGKSSRVCSCHRCGFVKRDSTTTKEWGRNFVSSHIGVHVSPKFGCVHVYYCDRVQCGAEFPFNCLSLGVLRSLQSLSVLETMDKKYFNMYSCTVFSPKNVQIFRLYAYILSVKTFMKMCDRNVSPHAGHKIHVAWKLHFCGVSPAVATSWNVTKKCLDLITERVFFFFWNVSVLGFIYRRFFVILNIVGMVPKAL